MKVAVVSDIHDNLANLETFLKYLHKTGINTVLCCGDLTNSETLYTLAKGVKGDIFLVRGNIEIYNEEETKNYHNVHYFGPLAYFQIENKNIALCHEPFWIEKIKKQYPDTDFIFYGHTHKPWSETSVLNNKNILIANPGNLANTFHPATFAVWDINNNQLDLKRPQDLDL
ncbi:MAG: YfcE family phosphodiesterase [Planctomycetes bacterium]|jgi:putative phosphoesterase|nr:YfcE family phosphodiesterase [Planctomycetota bacterium]